MLSLEITVQISQGHSLAEGGGTSGDLVQLPAQSRFTYSRLLGALSGWVFDIAKDGDSTVSLSNLCQCLTNLTVKKFLLTFNCLIKLRLKGLWFPRSSVLPFRR